MTPQQVGIAPRQRSQRVRPLEPCACEGECGEMDQKEATSYRIRVQQWRAPTRGETAAQSALCNVLKGNNAAALGNPHMLQPTVATVAVQRSRAGRIAG